MFDIELPDGTSFDILKEFSTWNFHLIFTTSHDSYAIKAFQYNAIDYILKPIEKDSLSKAIRKVVKLKQQENQDEQIKLLLNNISFPQNKTEKIVLNTSDFIHIIEIDQIIYCQSEDTYTYFYTTDGKKLLISNHLKEYENLLTPHQFFRTHRSYLVNLKHISHYDKKTAELTLSNGNKVPVSQRKREIITQNLKNQQSV